MLGLGLGLVRARVRIRVRLTCRLSYGRVMVRVVSGLCT